MYDLSVNKESGVTIFSKINQALIHKTEDAADNIAPYGALGIIGFVFFYFLNALFIENSVKEEIFLRSIAGFFCFTLMLKNYWPKSVKHLLPIYWHTALIFNIPFFFTFMLFKKPDDILWPIYWVLALTLLILLVDWISFLIISVLGVGLAIFVNAVMDPPLTIPSSLGALVTAYVTFASYYIFLFRNKQYKVRLNSLKIQAAAIAHEMRTPLSAIEIITDTLETNVPILVNSQKKIQDMDKSVKKINPITLKEISNSPTKLKTIARKTFHVIDMLLLNLTNDIQPKSEITSILKCVYSALEDYPLSSNDRKIITVDTTTDFMFSGDESLMKHILFNLLKNALYHIKAINKGTIRIWTEPGKRYNMLHFEDTGAGIDKKDIKHIFDQFFTKTAYGSGVGLAFCKISMTKIGGDISCRSIKGEYTRFTLSFPVVPENHQKR